MKQLHALVRERFIEPIDAELGGLLARRAAASLPDLSEVQVVALAGALLSGERARGHSCVPLASIAGRVHGTDAAGLALPDVATCRAILQRSGLCGDGTGAAPLVLEDDRLYLYRYHAAERRLAAALRARLAAPAPDAGFIPPETVERFRRYFPPSSDGAVDWQAVAAAAALRSGLTVITGGPGTGKTHTVARVLALLLGQDPSLRVAVAAPTGKAAARLAESIRHGAATLPMEAHVRAALPQGGHTLHRLLGYQPSSDTFRHGAQQPLGEDVVVVDEASMVDLLMMDALFAAVRPSARVILLGDQDQLASVDTGYVLGDICGAADDCGAEHGAGLAAWFARLSGTSPAEASPGATALRDAVVRLRKSWRFDERPGIGRLAGALRAGDADAAVAVLSERRDDVHHRPGSAGVATLLEPVEAAIEAYFAAESPDEALERLNAFRILCALREGPHGAAGLNDAVERWLRARGLVSRAAWYDRRPVLITANDPATGLFNGDVGVTFNDGGRTLVHFPVTGGTRAVSPARMPAHATAWAMTVHRSQGSEFGSVELVLPPEDSRVLTRELLYTGVTRARRRVTIHGSEPVLRAAVARVTDRASGLRTRLSRDP